MSNKTTSYLVMFPMSEIVKWRGDEYDEDDFYPNPHLQMIANHLTVPFPICHLYKTYFYGPLEGSRHCHFFKSTELGNKTLLVMDLHEYDETDQHEMVYLGIKCQEKYTKRVKKCLGDFLKDMDLNPVVNPYSEAESIDFLEKIIEEYKT